MLWLKSGGILISLTRITQLTIKWDLFYYFRNWNHDGIKKPGFKLLKNNRIVAFSYLTCYANQQVIFREGYNSAVEYHLDMVEVISSILIIPKPNVSPSIKQIFVFSLIVFFTPEAHVIYTSFFHGNSIFFPFIGVKKKWNDQNRAGYFNWKICKLS